MNWNDIIRNIFYITGIIFFIMIIIAAYVFIRRAIRTSNVIKRFITSAEVEDIIMKVKDGVAPLMSVISRK